MRELEVFQTQDEYKHMLSSPLMGLVGMKKGNQCQAMYKILYGSKSPFKFLKIKWAINSYEN